MLVSVTVSTHSLLVRQDMAPHSKYVKAERALNAIATMSCKKICMKGDDAMSRSLSSKSILRLDRFLSTWLPLILGFIQISTVNQLTKVFSFQK